MLTKFQELENNNASRDELEELALGSLSKAVYEGDVENGSVMAGQITGMVRDIRPAKEIIETLFKDAEAIASSLKIAY